MGGIVKFEDDRQVHSAGFGVEATIIVGSQVEIKVVSDPNTGEWDLVYTGGLGFGLGGGLEAEFTSSTSASNMYGLGGEVGASFVAGIEQNFNSEFEGVSIGGVGAISQRNAPRDYIVGGSVGVNGYITYSVSLASTLEQISEIISPVTNPIGDFFDYFRYPIGSKSNLLISSFEAEFSNIVSNYGEPELYNIDRDSLQTAHAEIAEIRNNPIYADHELNQPLDRLNTPAYGGNDDDSNAWDQRDRELEHRNPGVDFTRGNPEEWGPPVILDLNGDGIDISFGTDVAFDYDDDGYREQTAWVGPEDGFLVIDLDANGELSADGGDGDITQSKELVFSHWHDPQDANDPDRKATDLEALANAVDPITGNKIFDSNGDGKLTSGDNLWASLKVWRDVDQDGEVDDGELLALDLDDADAVAGAVDLNITEINLIYDDESAYSNSDNDISVLGNTLHGSASFVMNGETIEGGVGDVSLAADRYGYKEDADGNITLEGFTYLVADADADIVLADPVTDEERSGAFGDDRENSLDASAVTVSTVLDGGAGNDSLQGGSAGDLLSGGAGADTINAGAGNDVVFADAADSVDGIVEVGGVVAAPVIGGDGYDRLIMSADAVLSLTDLSLIGFEAIEAGDGSDAISGLDDATGYILSGNGGEDTLSSAGGNDILTGGDGNDSLTGNAGDDRLFGDAGNDVIDAGDGHDFVRGGLGDDTLTVGSGDDHIQYWRGDGNDIVQGVTDGVDGGFDLLELGYGIGLSDVTFGMDQDDAVFSIRALDDAETTDVDESVSEIDGTIRVAGYAQERNRIEAVAVAGGIILDTAELLSGSTGYGGDDVLFGTHGVDWINAGAGDDTLAGGGGNDILIAGAGDDLISASSGDDFVVAGDGADTLLGDDGDDRLFAEAGDDLIEAGSGDDVISGGAGSDVIRAGKGNDVLFGGRGDDTLDGGEGDDTYHYFRGDGRDVIQETGQDAIGQEEYTYQEGEYYYGPTGSPNDAWGTMYRTVTLTGYRDVIISVSGWDVIEFGYSIDVQDIYFELSGDNLVMGLRQNDVDDNALTLDGFDDVLTAENWTDELERVEELKFRGGYSIDISEVSGFVSGYDDADLLEGTAERDLISAGAGNDTLNGAAGDDLLFGANGDDILDGGAGLDELFGGLGNDTLIGGDGDDRLIAESGDDELRGGAGADVLHGGRGDDTLIGGTGDDIYLFNRGDGHDVIDETLFNTGGEIISGFDEEYSASFIVTGKMGEGSTVWVNETRMGASSTIVEGGNDTLQFGAWIDISDLILTYSEVSDSADNMYGQRDLTVELAPIRNEDEVSDSITIRNQTTVETRIETFVFSSGFSVDMTTVGNTLNGTSENDVLSGTGWLSGGAGDDTLNATPSGPFQLVLPSIFIGGEGNDTLNGIGSDDRYVFSRGHGNDVIVETGHTDTGDIISFDAGIEIEDLVLQRQGDSLVIHVGSKERMTTPLSEISDTITVRDWHLQTGRVELLQFANGVDLDLAVVEGTFLGADVLGIAALDTPSDDNLTGSALGDWIDGFAGNDTLDGLGGKDFMLGRDGDDSILGGAGDDVISGGDGSDTIDGGADNDLIVAGSGNDSVDGGTGDDILMGGSGNDTLSGGAGDDVLIGDSGDDVFIAGLGDDIVRIGRGSGADTYQANATIGYSDRDIVLLDDGIEADELIFTQEGDDLLMTIERSGSSLLMEDWATGTRAFGINVAGTMYTAAEIDTLRAEHGERLVENTDQDIASADIAEVGFGDYTITELNGKKQFALASVAIADVTMSGTEDGRLLLSWASGAVELAWNEFDSFTFADGVEFSQLRENITRWGWGEDFIEALGTNGDDVIDAGGSVFMLEGFAGNDDLAGAKHLAGYDGDDTYRIDETLDDQFVFNELSGNDTVIMDFVSIDDVVVFHHMDRAWRGETLMLNWTQDDGNIGMAEFQLADQNGVERTIETFVFADGITASQDELLLLV